MALPPRPPYWARVVAVGLLLAVVPEAARADPAAPSSAPPASSTTTASATLVAGSGGSTTVRSTASTNHGLHNGSTTSHGLHNGTSALPAHHNATAATPHNASDVVRSAPVMPVMAAMPAGLVPGLMHNPTEGRLVPTPAMPMTGAPVPAMPVPGLPSPAMSGPPMPATVQPAVAMAPHAPGHNAMEGRGLSVSAAHYPGHAGSPLRTMLVQGLYEAIFRYAARDNRQCTALRCQEKLKWIESTNAQVCATWESDMFIFSNICDMLWFNCLTDRTYTRMDGQLCGLTGSMGGGPGIVAIGAAPPPPPPPIQIPMGQPPPPAVAVPMSPQQPMSMVMQPQPPPPPQLPLGMQPLVAGAPAQAQMPQMQQYAYMAHEYQGQSF